MSKFEDPRINRLPKWARDLFAEARKAEQWAEHEYRRANEAEATADRLRAEYAREHGAETFDTWYTIDQENGADFVAFGLGTGQRIEFGTDPETGVGDWAVTFRDGGLDVRTMYTGMRIITGRPLSGVDLRIEAD